VARTSLKLSWRRESASGEAVSFHGVITVAACRAVLWCKKGTDRKRALCVSIENFEGNSRSQELQEFSMRRRLSNCKR
jgi:hypothetical protein